MKNLIGATVFLSSAIALTGSAEAAPTVYEFTGQITSATGLAASQHGQPLLGDTFRATFLFDPAAPNQNHTSGLDRIGDITTASGFTIGTPNDAAFTSVMPSGEVFIGIPPMNSVIFQGNLGSVNCQGSGGVTITGESSARFGFTCFSMPQVVASGTVTGTGTFRPAANTAVPEPATWAMLIFGFGAVGFSMRRSPAAMRTCHA